MFKKKPKKDDATVTEPKAKTKTAKAPEKEKVKSTLAKSGPPATAEKYYIKASILRELIRESYVKNTCSPELGQAIIKIAEGLARLPNFVNYSFKDEMVGDAVMNMWKAISEKKYHINSDFNPFSYLTAIAYNSFVSRIKKEKKYHQTVKDFQEQQFEELINDPELGPLINIYVERSNNSDEK